MSDRQSLINLYQNKSKHSNYQILSKRLRELIGSESIVVRTRYESERLKYLLNKIDVTNKSILDIGANTGFFSFELLDAGAKHVHYYEGNNNHAQFVKLAAKALSVEDKITVTNNYFTFTNEKIDNYDVGLLFNVLHHVGDDYGSQKLSIGQTKNQIITQLNSMSYVARTLVFQLGFNWKGDPAQPLFDEGTKEQMIDFVESGVRGHWRVEHIAVAVGNVDTISYEEVNRSNVHRDDSLGEFLNRPIFILHSLNL